MIFEQNFIIIYIFILGLMAGSFVSVLSSRNLDDWRSILYGRSRCPQCRHTLTWKELIPIFSFLFQKGKCQSCQSSISLKYPLLEIICATIFTALYVHFGLTGYFGAYSLLTIFFLSIIVTDIEEMIIPDHLIILCLIPLLWLTIIEPNLLFRFYGLVIYTVVIGLLVVPSQGKWMGWADLKLAPILGWLIGYPQAISGLYSSFVIGAIIGLLIVVISKKTIKAQVPFGPFLLLGFYIALWYGNNLIDWYLTILG